MLAALFHLQYLSARNRLVTRFKRLKKPKYLFGAIVGGFYFYFYFFRYLFKGFGGGQSAGNLVISPEHQLLIESCAALALFIILLLAWIIPHERAALTFTEAEVAFLFPAPVSRRTLVHFKLMRSQLRILFSALLLTLFSRRFGGHVWIHAIGWWLLLSTMNLHFLGSSFTRTMLLDRGLSNRGRRLLILALVAGAGAGIWYWAKATLPPPTAADTADWDSIQVYAQQVFGSGPALYLLYPFQLIVRPFFAPDTATFFNALPAATLIFLLHYLWVIGSDVSFEEASLAASQKLAARVAAYRAGNWQGASAQKKQKPRRPWFQLSPTGPAVTALLWKNLLGVGQVLSPRLLIVFGIILGMFVYTMGGSIHGQNIAVIVEFAIAIILGYSLLLGPQLLRMDFRRNLSSADILKTFPLPGWQIALGEILAPVTVLAGVQWLLLLVGFALIFFLPGKYVTLSAVIGIGLIPLLPLLDFLLLLIPNATVLLFPSWVQAGKDSPRGIEATGQRLIFAVGQMLVLMLALLPAFAAFSAVYFPMKWALGPVMPIPFAALAAAVILGVEAWLGVMLLGKLFDRFDVTEEPGS